MIDDRLSDEHLALRLARASEQAARGDVSAFAEACAYRELQAHRATRARLEAWAAELRRGPRTGRFIAQELENRIAGVMS